MSASVAPAAVASGAREPSPPLSARPPAQLTRRATLNAAASLLDYAVKIVVGLVVTPVLVSGLGRQLFGVWEMLSRLGSYVHAADGRPSEALRLVIAQHQGSDDDEAKRRVVGASLTVWVLVLPLVAMVGGALVWLAPGITQAPPELRGEVRLTATLLVGNFMLASLASVPESVLRGMNLGYKRMGWQSGLNVVGGGLAAAAVLAGLGLTGLAGAQAVRTVAAALCFILLARSFVAWFGVARPMRSEVKALFGMSVWLTAGDAVAKIMLASDVLVLGAVVAPAVVTTYALTGYAARVAVGVHVFAAGAAIPGLGGLLGAGQMERAAQARRELLVLTWLFVTVVGTGILLWNRSFVAMWVGPENYAGLWIDILIVLIAAQTAFIRTDAYIIDAALQPRLRVVLGAVAAAVTIGLSVALTRAYGLLGLCLGIIAGRATQSLAYPALVRSCLRGKGRRGGGRFEAVRLALATSVMFALGAALGQRLAVSSWATWTAGAAASVPVATLLAVALGPSATARRALLTRLRSIVRLGGRG
jgi:O-antigen/teichoic acid export membrane protein